MRHLLLVEEQIYSSHWKKVLDELTSSSKRD